MNIYCKNCGRKVVFVEDKWRHVSVSIEHDVADCPKAEPDESYWS